MEIGRLATDIQHVNHEHAQRACMSMVPKHGDDRLGTDQGDDDHGTGRTPEFAY